MATMKSVLVKRIIAKTAGAITNAFVKGFKVLSTSPTNVKKALGKVMSFIVKGTIKVTPNKMINFILKALFGIDVSGKNVSIDDFIKKNKEMLQQNYGKNISDKYEKFMKEGFRNGLGHKFLGSFGQENVKDRAIIIFDKTKNPVWNLKNINSYSVGKWRTWWFFLSTYKASAERNYTKNIDKSLVFFTSTLATKGSWTGTYYGPIDNPREGYYDVHWGRAILEWTNLKLTPTFEKKSQIIAKSQFVAKNLDSIESMVDIFENDSQVLIDSGLEKEEVQLFKNYPKQQGHINKNLRHFSSLFW
ncbi:hypothetical protein [Mesoplasma seiffertii]|uniref:hypothetical protein n=1 Tax=Mesoplasma seiffertii TaxID=28224 RepID=UPI0012EB60A1|nr:hypothetical protein [Mesoplasma seiffertii]